MNGHHWPPGVSEVLRAACSGCWSARGNAVNFIPGAALVPFIFLVQAEILAAIRMLTRGDLAPGIYEVPAPDREAIAATWLSYFNR
ncbi:hypothetical protein ABID95_004225 [Streptomyces atratus]